MILALPAFRRCLVEQALKTFLILFGYVILHSPATNITTLAAVRHRNRGFVYATLASTMPQTQEPSYRPQLIVIGGYSGSGKTTLAQGLARALSLPLLSKDVIKETLFDSLG